MQGGLKLKNTKDIQEYYSKLIEYRDLLTKRVETGKLDVEKSFTLTDKLNEWYEVAREKVSQNLGGSIKWAHTNKSV